MNKLLQHIMNAGGGTDKFLPFLEQFQTKGEYKGKSPLLELASRQGPVYDNIPNPAIYRAKAEMDMKAKQQAAVNAMRERQGEIRPAGPKRSAMSKALAIAANPMTAASYVVKGQDIPENFDRGSLNAYDHVMNMVNPFGLVDAGVSIPGNLKDGNYGQAALNTLAVLPALSAFKGVRSVGKSAPAFENASSNSGFVNFLMTPGDFNPVGIAKDHTSGLARGAGEQLLGLLRETGLFPNKTPRRPFFETFPITKAQKAKMRAMQDEAMNDALEFTKKYWYGDNAEDLRPVLEDKIRAIVPDLKRANLPNNLERSSVNNPFNKVEDRLVTNTTWGEGREGLDKELIDYLNRKRGNIRGVNFKDNQSITLRNRGLYYSTPKEIAETVVHESGHTAQNFGPVADFKQNLFIATDQPWNDVITAYDPKYNYFTSNPNTELGRRFQNALVEPSKRSRMKTWRSSPGELHSEMMSGKYNLYKQGLKQGLSEEEMINRVTNPSEKELDWIIKNMRLDRHFKPGTSLEERRSLMKLLPAAVPAVFGAGMLDEKEEGGETEEPKEYKGSSIVDYLATKGYSGKKAFRKGLAEEYGVEDYDFSAKKNLELLARMRENDELLRAKKEDFAPIPVERIEQMYAERAAQQPSVQPIVNAVQEQKEAEKQKRLSDLRRRMTLELGFDPFVEGPRVKKIETPKLSLSSKNPYGVFNLFTGFGNQGSTKQQPAAPVQNKPAPAPVVQQPAPPPAVAKTAPFRFDLAPVPKPGNASSFIQFPPYPTKQMAQLPKGRTAEVAAKELEKEEDNRAWYEKLWDSYSEAVNNSQIFGKGKSGITLGGAGFTPEGAKIITRDLTKGVLSVVSEDLAEKYKNKMERQDAKLNPNERKSILDPSKVKFDPVYVTGDTIPDTKRRYHIPEVIDLDYMRFGVRNRGDMREIQTEGAPITTFEPFQSSKQYFAKTKDPANATYVGVAPDGRIKVGGRDQFQDQDYQVTRTYGNKIVDFNRDATGSIVKVPSNPKASKETLSPSVKVLGDDGKVVDGKLSLLLPRTGNQEESFDLVTGGRYILQTPDGKTKLVSGSLKNIEGEFYKMKKNHPWVNVITLDNGSYARGIRTFDQKLTKQDLKGYDNQNTGGGNFAYILPGERKTRYESKFTDFEAEAKRRLQSMYPGKKVSIGFQNEGLYDQTGGRDIESQVGIQKKGNSQTPVSLHNFGAAKDYILYVDGKPIDPEQFKKLYKDVLWGAADKTGLHHLEDWDVAHISLAKEGQKTAFDELYAKYPDIFAHPNFVRSLNYVNKNKNNPLYEEYYELLNNLQPFTGKPRTTEVMKRTMAKKDQGGPVVSEYGQWAYPGMDTIVPSGDITMKGVPYPVYGQDETGYGQMMYPGGEYSFPGNFVYEVPMAQIGGTVSKLLAPLSPMVQLVPTIAGAFSGDPLKKFINWINTPSGDPAKKPNLPGKRPNLDAMLAEKSSMYGKTYEEWYKKQKDVIDQLNKNNSVKYENSADPLILSSGRFKGAKVAPEMVSDIVKAAKANNVDPWVMLSLVGRESTFGSGTRENKNRTGDKMLLTSGWTVAEDYMPYGFDRFLADKQVPGVSVRKTNHGWKYDRDQKQVEKYLQEHPELLSEYKKKLDATPSLGDMDSFSLAAKRIKDKGIRNYNPGDPKYSEMIQSDMKLLKSDPKMSAFMKSLGYAVGGSVPMFKSGGQHGGLDRWFAEKWVDVKTGKACGRQEGENRSYPACRPSKRISSKTPKTSSEMSPSEKAKFKRTKTSSERIPYNHKRN